MKLMPFVLAFAISAGAVTLSYDALSADRKTGASWEFSLVSCGKFVDARRSNTAGVYQWWLAGYLSAMNQQLPDTYNLVGSDDLHGPMLWLENWCVQNPLKDMQDGADELFLEL
jgi:hypothetical protein